MSFSHKLRVIEMEGSGSESLIIYSEMRPIKSFFRAFGFSMSENGGLVMEIGSLLIMFCRFRRVEKVEGLEGSEELESQSFKVSD
jgi:hypothetical protein